MSKHTTNTSGSSGSATAPRMVAAVAATLLGMTLASCSAANGEDPAPSQPQGAETSEPTTSTDPPAPEGTGEYRDGLYTETGWYGSLPSSQDVTLTIENDIVIDVDITTPAEDATSLGYQQRFAVALPGEILGRDIDDIAVDRLAGASGCSEGFMSALELIKASASAG